MPNENFNEKERGDFATISRQNQTIDQLHQRVKELEEDKEWLEKVAKARANGNLEHEFASELIQFKNAHSDTIRLLSSALPHLRHRYYGFFDGDEADMGELISEIELVTPDNE